MNGHSLTDTKKLNILYEDLDDVRRRTFFYKLEGLKNKEIAKKIADDREEKSIKNATTIANYWGDVQASVITEEIERRVANGEYLIPCLRSEYYDILKAIIDGKLSLTESGESVQSIGSEKSDFINMGVLLSWFFIPIIAISIFVFGLSFRNGDPFSVLTPTSTSTLIPTQLPTKTRFLVVPTEIETSEPTAPTFTDTPTPSVTPTETFTPIPKATFTVTSTPTSIPSSTPSNTPIPVIPTTIPTLNPLDLDLDNVLHDPDNGQYDLCLDARGTQDNCGCPEGMVPQSCGNNGGGDNDGLPPLP